MGPGGYTVEQRGRPVGPQGRSSTLLPPPPSSSTPPSQTEPKVAPCSPWPGPKTAATPVLAPTFLWPSCLQAGPVQTPSDLLMPRHRQTSFKGSHWPQPEVKSTLQAFSELTCLPMPVSPQQP